MKVFSLYCCVTSIIDIKLQFIRSGSRTKKSDVVFVLFIFEVHCLFGHETGIFYTHLQSNESSRRGSTKIGSSVLPRATLRYSGTVLNGRVSRAVCANAKTQYFL